MRSMALGERPPSLARSMRCSRDWILLLSVSSWRFLRSKRRLDLSSGLSEWSPGVTVGYPVSAGPIFLMVSAHQVQIC